MKDFSFLNKPVNTKLENKVSLGDTIRESEQAIIKGLDNYLDFNKVTYNQLLNHLIFEGKTTANKKEARLMLMPSEEVNGKKIPPTIVFGENRLALKELLLDDNKDKFIENLTTYRNRQVDINYLGDNLYKEYIDVNKIVTTNVLPSDTGSIFIQPVIEYNDNLVPFKEEVSNTAEETYISKQDTEEVIDEGSDLSALILKALENNSVSPSSPMTQDTNSFLDSINNVADEAEEDGETPLFKIMVPETNSISITREEIEDIKTIIPTDVPVTVVNDYIKVLNKGSYATGMFKNSMITLSTKAFKGTGYHEAFHSVFRTMLSSEEQTEYINEIKNMSEAPTKEQLEDIQVNNQVNEKEATNIYYEEILADEFALYKTDVNNSKFRKEYPKTIVGFFNKILDFINNIFNNDRKVEILFDNIAKGKYNKKSKTTSDINVYQKIDNVNFSLIDNTEEKEGVSEVFQENSELAAIGTPEQYSQYLDTIFPDSQVNDIVYHATDKTFDRFDKDAEKSTISENGIFFAPTINQVKGTYGKNVIRAIINSNPLISEDRIERISDKKKQELINSGYDGYIYSYNKTISSADDIVVFEPEQIHILGSKQDTEGFKEFVDKQNKEVFKLVTKEEIIDFAKGKAVNYQINSANTEILVPYSKFDKSIAYNIAKRMVTKINKTYPGAASLNTAYSTGPAVNIHPKQPKVEQMIDNSFERDLGYYKGDVALMEQEEGFNFTEYEITPEEWLSLSKEEKSKIIKCK